MPSQSPQQKMNPDSAFVLMAGNAEKGNPKAMLTLGTFYEQGVGTPRNFIKAMHWYRKAAEAGLPEGQYNLGICYEIGIGNGGDMKLALSHFQKAASLGLPQAMQKLSALSFAEHNNEEGFSWLIRAAEAGAADAANTLGVVYLEGLMGQQKDTEKAYDYFVKAADAGHLEAIKNIAVIYKNGLGKDKDVAQALLWYSIAQKGGYQAGDLGLIQTELKNSLPASQVDEIEKRAEHWIQAFQKKQETE